MPTPTPELELGLDKIERAIIDYVTKNSECTKNAVKTELNKKDKNGKRISSPKTTDLRINKLIQSRELEYKKKGKGFYQLYVSDKTLYNVIKKQIEKIESYALRISKVLEELDRFSRSAGLVKGPTMMYMNKFIMPYFTSIFTILERLLELSNSEKISMVDSHDLHTKIIDVMHKIRKQSQISDGKLFKNNKNILTGFSRELSRPGTRIIKNLDSDTVDDLIKIINDFENEKSFLLDVDVSNQEIILV